MEFLVTTPNAVKFNNKELSKATETVFKLGDAIKKNWFAIAHIVAHVDATECFKDDGFDTVHEWVEKTFGIKKTEEPDKPETEQEPEQEPETISVWDNHGNEFKIPVDILKKYLVKVSTLSTVINNRLPGSV